MCSTRTTTRSIACGDHCGPPGKPSVEAHQWSPAESGPLKLTITGSGNCLSEAHRHKGSKAAHRSSPSQGLVKLTRASASAKALSEAHHHGPEKLTSAGALAKLTITGPSRNPPLQPGEAHHHRWPVKLTIARPGLPRRRLQGPWLQSSHKPSPVSTPGRSSELVFPATRRRAAIIASCSSSPSSGGLCFCSYLNTTDKIHACQPQTPNNFKKSFCVLDLHINIYPCTVEVSAGSAKGHGPDSLKPVPPNFPRLKELQCLQSKYVSRRWTS